MAERTIVGVDFSGGDDDDKVGKTWVTKGYSDGGKLTICDCYPISRNDLEKLLMNLPSSAVAAMDFPFGVPQSFAKAEFGFTGTLMHDMWELVSNKLNDEPEYIKKIRPRLRKGGNRQKFNKLLREWDQKHSPNIALSPLNPARPDMFPMTFHGMKMLHTLWKKTGCRVPPLDDDERTGPVLLETMPGVALDARKLPYTEYKNNNGPNALRNLDNRKKIIDHLPDKFGITLPNFEDYRDLCIFNDDALDSIVAALVAAMWANDESLFHRPEDHLDPAVLAAAKSEGCIYAPKK